MFLFGLRRLLGRRNRLTRGRGQFRPRLEALEDRTLLAVFLVTSPDDSGFGSLRQAILNANVSPGLDTIQFNLPQGHTTITPSSPLPTLADAVYIDGTSQPGWDGGVIVLLDGNIAGTTSNGLTISADGCTIRGLGLANFSGNHAGILVTSNNNVIEDNLLVYDSTGVLILGGSRNHIGGGVRGNYFHANFTDGIRIQGTVGSPATGNVVQGSIIDGGNGDGIALVKASGNTIGGTGAATRNFIFGVQSTGIRLDRDSTDNQVVGNFIGTGYDGLSSLGNSGAGVLIQGGSSGNTIGGTTQGAGNVIAGNGGDGITIADTTLDFIGVVTSRAPTGNVIEGNYIGLGADGRTVLPNGGNGITVSSGADPYHNLVEFNFIGGTDPGAGNVISGNRGYGVQFLGAQTASNFVQGNLIGTDSFGSSARANTLSGVDVTGGASYNTIGGTAPHAGNVISGNGFVGVEIDGFSSGGNGVTTGNVVQGNKIGTDPSGTFAVGNSSSGVFLAFGTRFNTVGGSVSGAGNVISGNGSDGVAIWDVGTRNNTVAGNRIGTTADGMAALPNALSGVDIYFGASGNTVGGTDPGAGNLISGNRFVGVVIQGRGTQNNTVLGNKIGTTIDGASALANASSGVFVSQSGFNTIGGPGPGAGNLISGNGLTGVSIQDAPPPFVPTGGTSAGPGFLQLTPAATAAGFTLSTFATGFPPRPDGLGPMGIGFLADGRILVSNIEDGSVRVLPDADNQDASLVSPAPGATYGFNHAEGIAEVGGAVYLAQGELGRVVQLNSDGTVLRVVVHLPNPASLAADPYTGHLFVSNYQGAIYDVDPITGAFQVLTNFHANDLAFDPSTNVLYAAGFLDPSFNKHVLGFDVRTRVQVFDSGAIDPGNSSDLVTGVAVGSGLLAGNLFVNTTAGLLVEINLATKVQTPLAVNGLRGDQVRVDPNTGTLLVTQSDRILRLIPAAGAGFVGGSWTTQNAVAGNRIGTDASGTFAVPNVSSGVFLTTRAQNNTVGGSDSGSGNVISGNGFDGVTIWYAGAMSNTVAGNKIGTNSAGTAALPNLSSGVDVGYGASANTIGGTAPGAGNVISGNGFVGVVIDGTSLGSSGVATGNVVQGNKIGTDPTGTLAVGNALSGVFVSGAPSNTIGGTAPGAGNVISGNGYDGVAIWFAGATGNRTQGNQIGTDVSGTTALPNAAYGVDINVGASGNTVGGTDPGAGNLISGNRYAGVAILDTGTGNGILGNSIHDNGTLGIDLGGDGVTPNHTPPATSGPNNFENFPVLTSAATSPGLTTTISGTLDSTPGATFTIQFFASPSADPSGFGEGAVYLGQTSVTTGSTGSTGHAGFTADVNLFGQPGFITATATDANGNTSEFSRAIPLATFTQVSVTASATPAPAVVGDPITCTFQVANQSTLGSGNVLLNYQLPAGVSLVSAATTQGTFTQATPTSPLLFALGPVVKGTVVTVTVVVKTNTPGDLTNSVKLTLPATVTNLGNNTATVTTHVLSRNQAFVAQLYLDLLGRQAQPAEVQPWASGLDAYDANPSTGLSRAQVAQAIEGSGEYRTRVVQGLYQKLLKRSASNGEVGAWLANYPGQAQLEADILGSTEYFSHRGGLSNADFLDAVYLDVLGRHVDRIGSQTWLPLLPTSSQEPAVIDAQGDLSPDTSSAMTMRTAVALLIVQSPESDTALVRSLYQQLLRRPSDDAGLAGFVASMQATTAQPSTMPPSPPPGTGERIEAVEAAIAGSDEYFARL
jgi:uncharacterized repeat protein (TIGR01451 family)